MPRHPLTSSTAACCWIPLFALRCEEGRRPELASQPAALLAPDIARRLWQVSPLGRHAGVKPGMTVSQAIGLCPSLRLCEPDPVYYDEQFARLLAALSAVSPVVEPAELGRAYVGTDGLGGLYGAPEGVVEEMQMRDWGLGVRDWNNRRDHVLLSGRRARAARACAEPAARARTQASTSHRLAGAGSARPSRARARRVVVGRIDAQGPDRRPGSHRRAAPDPARAGAARRGSGAARGRVHRLRAWHRRTAALRPRRERRRAGGTAARAPHCPAGDQTQAQAHAALPRHRGAAMVAASGAAVCVDRL